MSMVVEATDAAVSPVPQMPGAMPVVMPGKLAVPDDSRAHSGGEFLSFRLGAEEYGIDILKVQEIRSYTPPTRLANAQDYIKGVVNLRGVIVPIVDLRIKFGLEKVEYNQFTVVIVLAVAGRTVGVVVDSVSDVLQLSSAQIRPVPEFNGAVDSAFITGIGTVEQSGKTAPGDQDAHNRMLILVDIERLLTSADLGLFAASIQ